MAPQSQEKTIRVGLLVASAAVVLMVFLFFIGSEQKMNMTLLRERGWLDVPIVYRDGRRAILAFEKGPVGERAFRRAFAAWDGPNSPSRRCPGT